MSAKKWDELSKEEQEAMREQIRKQLRDKAEADFNAWYEEYSQYKPVQPSQITKTQNKPIVEENGA